MVSAIRAKLPSDEKSRNMTESYSFLLSPQPRARWMRHDMAQLLKRFFFCERSLVVIMRHGSLQSLLWKLKSAWLVSSGKARRLLTPYGTRLRTSLPQPHFGGGRNRPCAGRALQRVKDSPSVPAFLLSLGKLLLPALRDAYQEYLEASDAIADGPTHRFLSLALSEKTEQIRAFEEWAESALTLNPDLREGALTWTRAVANRLSDVGGVGVGPSPQRPLWGICRDRRLMRFPPACQRPAFLALPLLLA